jgi:hypothetical protein
VTQSRWPVHPSPMEGESLSSWLRRLAMIYGLTAKELVEHDLGFQRRQRHRHWLDIDPPEKLLKAVAFRTGVPLERVQKTTIAGVRPFLYAYFDRKFSGCNTVLTARPNSPQHSQFLKWILRHELTNEFTACRLCLNTYPNAGVLLPWRIRIITSCPVHGIMLERVRIAEETVQWRNDEAEEAPELVRQLDCRTWQALTTGHVCLAGSSVHAGLWFRILRTIWDELDRPLEECHEKPVLSIWNTLDRFFEMAKALWRSSSERRHAICVATAIDMLEKGTVTPEGIDGKYFTGSHGNILAIERVQNKQQRVAWG